MHACCTRLMMRVLWSFLLVCAAVTVQSGCTYESTVADSDDNAQANPQAAADLIDPPALASEPPSDPTGTVTMSDTGRSGDSDPAAPTEGKPQPLGIGSLAPAIDVEHWISADAEPVTQFTEGNVYVIEFWATWCPPCIASMPHLAEVQEKYRDQGVRLISVSNEDLPTVTSFLERKSPSEENPDRTFGELTSVYSLTTDPDGSVFTDYMTAAEQSGIPTAFIVGKKGEIEWIGHPMEMDEPLEKVVSGQWDREAYQSEFSLMERMQAAMMQVRRGQPEAAMAALKELEQTKLSAEMAEQIQAVKLQVLMGMPNATEEFDAVAKNVLENAKDPMLVLGGTFFVYQASLQREVDPELRKQAIEVGEKTLGDAPAEAKATILDAMAHLHESLGDLDAAMAKINEALAVASEQEKARFQAYADELKAKLAGPASETPAEEPAAEEQPGA
ncbi:redoxin domain-containing protein [Planctomycetaceae bacterium SH139]